MSDVFQAILTRCEPRDLEPNCNIALQSKLQDVCNAIKQLNLSLERLREVERAVQQVALERTSSHVHVSQEIMDSVQALQLKLASAIENEANAAVVSACL